MNPPGLFCRDRVSIAPGVGQASPKTSAIPRMEPQPPAGPLS